MDLLNRMALAWAKWMPRAVLAATILVGCSVKMSMTSAPTDNRVFAAGQSPRNMTQEAILDLEVARLHAHVQPNGPVGVQWVEGLIERENVLAWTKHAGKGYLIQLDKSLTGFVLADTIVHEWAHAVAASNELGYVDDGADCGGHGPQWGVEFSRCYRAVWYNADTPDYQVVPRGFLTPDAPPGADEDQCPIFLTPMTVPSRSGALSTTDQRNLHLHQ